MKRAVTMPCCRAGGTGFAAFQQGRVALEQPEVAHRRAPAPADPVTQGVAGEGARRRADHRVRAVDMAEADQRAHREQQRQRRTTMPTTASASQNATRNTSSPRPGDARRSRPPCCRTRRCASPDYTGRDYTPALPTRSRRMSNLSGKTLFITGASRGIGLCDRAARAPATPTSRSPRSRRCPIPLPGTIHDAARARSRPPAVARCR